MKISKYFAVLMLIPLLAFTMHKYYISLCEVEYIEEKQSIQIITGLFIDDLELALSKLNNTKINIATNKEPSNIDEYFKEYLSNNLKLTINSKKVEFNYIGREYDDNLVRFYLEVTNVKKLESIEITNTCLLKYFEDQQNIIKLKVKNYHKTFYLDNNNTKGVLNFQK
jgi:hypothetical protein